MIGTTRCQKLIRQRRSSPQLNQASQEMKWAVCAVVVLWLVSDRCRPNHANFEDFVTSTYQHLMSSTIHHFRFISSPPLSIRTKPQTLLFRLLSRAFSSPHQGMTKALATPLLFP
eukprot:759257-Hanusia_phi.AAC.3